MLQIFYKTLLNELRLARVVKAKYWTRTFASETTVSHYLDVTLEVFEIRLDLVLCFDGYSIQVIDGNVILNKAIEEMWSRIMANLVRDTDMAGEMSDQPAEESAQVSTSVEETVEYLGRKSHRDGTLS